MKQENIIPAKELIDIRVIRSTYSGGDAEMLLSHGGKLIGISTFSKMEYDPEESGVRYYIGYEVEEKHLPGQVTHYGYSS